MNKLFVILITSILVVCAYALGYSIQAQRICEDKGYHVVSVDRGWLCVSADGRIMKK